MISVIVLGAGAGGGFPQWNSNAPACRRARAGDPQAAPRTQCSIAVSADGGHWFLLNSAPDLREQIEQTVELHPREGLRSSPIAGVVLAGSEVDAITGLLVLRERQKLSIYATPTIHEHLDANPIFEVLDRTLVQRVPITVGEPCGLDLPSGAASGLTVRAFAVPGKQPLYRDLAAVRSADAKPMPSDGTLALEISDGAHRLLFIPGCAAMNDTLLAQINGADCLFFDATLWQDDEMITAGLSHKTGAAMGHMSLDGANGVLAALRSARVPRRVLIHINNSNPILLADSPQRRIVEDAGWDVGADGMRFTVGH